LVWRERFRRGGKRPAVYSVLLVLYSEQQQQ
jgi:hypothetical protein